MTGVIFLIQGEKLIELREEEYDSEDLLQKILADYPKILAGDQIDSDDPRKWLLIAREMGVPDDEGAANRWSLDHLFIDQDGIPTFVEVKRCSDTRIRREVVSQMLDYAANGVEYWKIPELKIRFEQHCKEVGGDPVILMQNALGPEVDYDSTWDKVKHNLGAGKVRLLFVADEIPKELKRIVEFLNEKMVDVDVLAIEVKQFTGEKLKTLVPRVIGQTVQAENKKSPSTPRVWNKETILNEFAIKAGIPERDTVNEIFSWVEKERIPIKFGKGAKEGNFILCIARKDGQLINIFSINTSSHIYIQFDYLKQESPYIDENKRMELAKMINEKLGATISQNQVGGWPTIRISNLNSKERLENFHRIFLQIKTELSNS